MFTGRFFRENCPFKPTHKFWVREKWATGATFDGWRPADIAAIKPEIFFADMQSLDTYVDQQGGRWRSALHLPYKLHRMQIEVNDVHAMRLNDITEEDAINEGVLVWAEYAKKDVRNTTATDLFRDLWESLHGIGSWDKNPWVWRVKFDTHIVDAPCPDSPSEA